MPLARLDLARRAGITQFGDRVDYTPAAGSTAFPVAGVYRPPHEQIDVAAATGISTTAPVLGIDLEDFLAARVAAGYASARPGFGDTLVISGVTYRVDDVQPDSSGDGLDLVLHAIS